jgi:hypothetical protein
MSLGLVLKGLLGFATGDLEQLETARNEALRQHPVETGNDLLCGP